MRDGIQKITFDPFPFPFPLIFKCKRGTRTRRSKKKIHWEGGKGRNRNSTVQAREYQVSKKKLKREGLRPTYLDDFPEFENEEEVEETVEEDGL